MSESSRTPVPEKRLQAGRPRRRWLVTISVVGGALLVLAAVVLILFLGLRRVLFRKTNPGMPLEVTKPTVTALTSPLPSPSCETIISSGEVEMAVALPISLTVQGKAFPVVPIVAGERGWPAAPGHPGAAAWICGTVVNYVVGLESTPENEALLAGMAPGDEVKLRLSSGAGLIFRFVSEREAAAGEASVFEQRCPGLTLVLERGDGRWQVAAADYVAETEPIEVRAGAVARPEQPTRVGDLRVTVIKGHAERSEGGASPGTMYYLVEFSVENLGVLPLEADEFAMQLKDGMGNSYLLSPAASGVGEYGQLSREVAPGATAQGTAGYVVPETLVGPALTWTFSPGPASEVRARVSIPYEAEAEGGVPPSAAQAEVAITDVFLNSSGDVLIIEGEVRNTGAEALSVGREDVSITSSAGISDLRMAAPPLPWTVQPGQSQVIELQYDRPAASTALLALLGYSFEIQGLQ